jgi:D-tyrosyl-tRNA(Tyr) deacylase
VVQRVRRASVTVNDEVVGVIGAGLLIFLGVAATDVEADGAWMARKIAGLRVFPDTNDKMNVSLVEAGLEALVVSQFTLYGDCRKGRRPSFNRAARPEQANALYQRFCVQLSNQGVAVQTGTFQAMMQVELVNDGPVTLMVESP